MHRFFLRMRGGIYQILVRKTHTGVTGSEAHREYEHSLCAFLRIQRAVFQQAFFIIDRSGVCSPNLITGERMLPVYINRNAAWQQKGGTEVVLYLKAESDIPDLVVDFIEVKLKSGQIISLTWDESEFDREDGQFEARYKGVYFDDAYGNGRLPELNGMEVQYIELYTECTDTGSFKLRELSFYDGEESLVFTYPECQTERNSDALGNLHE